MPFPNLRTLATTVGRALGLSRVPAEAQPEGPARPRTVEVPAPRKARADAAGRTLEAARRRARYDMDPGSASPLKKAMRLRRIETGTEGAHDPRFGGGR